MSSWCTSISEIDGMGQAGQIFNTDPHSSIWCWWKLQNKTGSDVKNRQFSNLKITNGTHPGRQSRTGLWKTRWRMFNSTRKTGFATGLFNFFNRVFNMWKKSGPSTECIARFCGKLFPWAKRQGLPRSGAAAGGTFLQRAFGRFLVEKSGEAS